MAAAVSDQESGKELKRIEPEKVEIMEPKEPECVAAESGEKTEEKKIEPRVAEEVKEIKTNEEPKTAEPETVAAASTESRAKIQEKSAEPPVADEAKEIRTYEKPKAEDAVEPTAQKADDKQVKSPAIEEETKTEDRPTTEGTKETVLESGKTNNSEPITEWKSEDKTGTGNAAEKQESRSESAEEKREELPSKAEELPAAEVETIEPDDVKVSKFSESTPLVEEKPLEQPEVAELTVKEPILVDPVKDVEVETGIDKLEDSKLPIEVEGAKEETIVVEISDQVDSDTPEIKVLVKDVEYSPSGEVLEKTVETGAEKIEPRKNEVETEEKSVVADKSSAECEGDTERTVLSEAISRDIELAPENEKKEETVASGETNTAAEVDDKAEKEATITEREAKETKLEEGKKDDEAVKADAQDSECTNDSEEKKTSRDVPKEDVPVKKQSNNIIKMVKHSLGKAKKAITGKSQNSKAPAASETKDELSK
ncbi:uncharacterized protein LOC142553912 [Primulina tabacum]|uniref:uncharacterized protein LOC142553912 n=1 Tax=Primulina tabacum TaxID=48773 RepID=UPI003F5A73BE